MHCRQIQTRLLTIAITINHICIKNIWFSLTLKCLFKIGATKPNSNLCETRLEILNCNNRFLFTHGLQATDRVNLEQCYLLYFPHTPLNNRHLSLQQQSYVLDSASLKQRLTQKTKRTFHSSDVNRQGSAAAAEEEAARAIPPLVLPPSSPVSEQPDWSRPGKENSRIPNVQAAVSARRKKKQNSPRQKKEGRNASSRPKGENPKAGNQGRRPGNPLRESAGRRNQAQAAGPGTSLKTAVKKKKKQQLAAALFPPCFVKL